MPVHDWTKVSHDVFHDYHARWITHITETLNEGVLPDDYYAQSEKKVDRAIPDVVTLRAGHAASDATPPSASSGNGAKISLVETAPPKVRFCMEPGEDKLRVARKRVAIRTAEGDETVAIIEVVSPGNKSSSNAIRDFVKKARRLIVRGIHLLIVDVLPTGPRDPQGVHGLIWKTIDESQPYIHPPDKPLSLNSYRGNPGVRAYIEPIAVGDELSEMPLFLDLKTYVNVPLEQTYQRTFRAMPARLRKPLEQ